MRHEHFWKRVTAAALLSMAGALCGSNRAAAGEMPPPVMTQFTLSVAPTSVGIDNTFVVAKTNALGGNVYVDPAELGSMSVGVNTRSYTSARPSSVYAGYALLSTYGPVAFNSGNVCLALPNTTGVTYGSTGFSYFSSAITEGRLAYDLQSITQSQGSDSTAFSEVFAFIQSNESKLLTPFPVVAGGAPSAGTAQLVTFSSALPNGSVTETLTPEPAGLALPGLGSLALLARRRRAKPLHLNVAPTAART